MIYSYPVRVLWRTGRTKLELLLFREKQALYAAVGQGLSDSVPQLEVAYCTRGMGTGYTGG